MPYSAAALLVATRNLLNEPAQGFFSDGEIGEWLAHAALDISGVAQCVEARTDIEALLSQWDYALPTDCIEARHVVWIDTGQALRKITPTMVGEHNPAVDGDRPLTWFEWGKRLYIDPRPNSQAEHHNLRVFYTSITSDPTALNDVYQWLTVTYATYRGKLKDKRFAEAGLLFAEYANALIARKLDIQQRTPHTEADLQLAAHPVVGGGG